MSKSAVARKYHDRVAAMGCIVCRNLGQGQTPAAIHHIRAGQGMAQRADDFLVIPLCPLHHQLGGQGVAIHAGQKQWESLYGTEMDLLAQTIREVMG